MKKILLFLFSFFLLLNKGFSQNSWIQRANFGGTARYGSAGFSIGTKIYLGTGVDGAVRQDFWEWDQSANTWSQKADFGGGPRYSAAAFSIGAKGYLGTGMDDNSVRRNDFWEWDQSSNTWTQKANFGGTAREGAIAFSIGTKGYLGTGEESINTYKNDFWEWDQAGNSWTQKTNFGGAARTLATAFSIGTKGYIGTGIDAAGTVYKDFWEWDQTGNTWTQKTNFGGVARYGCASFAVGTKGYIAIGRDASLNYKQDVWEWNQSGNTWAQKINFTGSARNGTVGFAIGTRGYIATGYDGNYKNDLWEWNTVLNVIASVTNPTCFGQCNGSVTAIAGSGVTPYTFLWSNSETTTAITGLCNGSFSVTVTDANNDTADAMATVTPPALLVSSPSQINVLCNSDNTGMASVSVSGGILPYTYLWDNSETTSAISNLSAGNYSVAVTDANGCTATSTFSITEPTALSAPVSHTNVLCHGGNTGTATVNASGGVPAYTYSWNNGASTSSVTGLSVGNYTVIVHDGNSCSVSAVVSITQPLTLSASINATSSTCFNSNGNATANVSGGTPAYTYSWSSGATTSSATGLTAGTYSVLVTDHNGCTKTVSKTISNVGGVTSSVSSTNISCNGMNNGTATCTLTGNFPPFTFSWSNGSSTSAVTGLSPGNYSVTVTDGTGCTATSSVVISQPAALNSSFSQTNLLCNGASTGSATVVISGGTPSYTYSWSNGASTSAMTNLSAGNYSVAVADANNCTWTTTFSITQPTALSISTSSNPAICLASDGSATVTVSGGISPYTYSWSNGGSTSAITGLYAGTYTILVTDNNSCTKTSFANVSNTGAATATITSSGNVSCNGGSDGFAVGSASGGTSPYTFSWNTSPVQTTANVSGLSAGIYNATVTDANGCIDIASVIITEPAALSVSFAVSNVSCNGGSNGTISAVVSGGTPAYTYLWNNSQTVSAISNLAVGNYSLSVTDSKMCAFTATVSVSEPAILTATVSSQNVNCYSGNDGSASAIVAGGTAPYTFAWNNSQSAATAVGLSAGNYSVLITDAHGCSTSQTISITQPPILTALTSSQNVSCNGMNDGAASVSVSGGTLPYTYSWSSGSSASSATGLSPGTYTVFISDSHNCAMAEIVSITQPLALTATISSQANATCFGSANGSATASASGGTFPYTFLWSTTPVQSSSVATGLAAGNYSVTAFDANGCSSGSAVLISQPTILNAFTNTVAPACAGNCDTLTATASGGNGGFSFLWQPGNINAPSITICPTITTVYTITVTDAANCKDTITSTVTVKPLPVVTFTLSVDTVCINNTAFALSGGLPAGGNYSGAGVSAGNFDPAGAGLGAHTLVYSFTDTSGCSDSAATLIFVDACNGIAFYDADESIIVFPNPSMGIFELQIDGTQFKSASVEIYGALGEKVYQSIITSAGANGKSIIDLRNAAKGIYHLRMKGENKIIDRKIVIQ